MEFFEVAGIAIILLRVFCKTIAVSTNLNANE
jgi:hypothetical protein